MSAKSWKNEFYPIEACDVEGPDLALVEHSLQKWIGLRKENLERHGLEKPPIKVSFETCSLCKEYYDKDNYEDSNACGDCPLCQVRGGYSCGSIMEDEDENEIEDDSPFHRYSNNSRKDPEPMIQWLEKTKEFVLNR